MLGRIGGAAAVAAEVEAGAVHVEVDAGVARVGSRHKVRIGAVEQAEPQPPMFWFRDSTGHTLLVVEQQA